MAPAPYTAAEPVEPLGVSGPVVAEPTAVEPTLPVVPLLTPRAASRLLAILRRAAEQERSAAA